MANTIFLRLEGPMQSWGERAQWSIRDTAAEPTKSGVVGLLGCALGLSEDDDLRQLSSQLRMGVPCDRAGSPVVDFHTVIGGVLSAEGKIKKNAKTHAPETVVSHRSYLCDASFLVALQGAPELIERLQAAVNNPHWPVYLGRKSCPLGSPIFVGTGDFPSLEAALSSQPLDGRASHERTVRAVIECAPGEGVRRRDEVDSRSRRTFYPRYIQDVLLTLKTEEVQ